MLLKPRSVVLLTALLAGCAAEEGKGPTTRTSDAALRDPFGNWSKIDNATPGNKSGDPTKSTLEEDWNRLLLK